MYNPDAYCKHEVMHRDTNLEEPDDYLVWRCQNPKCGLAYHAKNQSPEITPIFLS